MSKFRRVVAALPQVVLDLEDRQLLQVIQGAVVYAQVCGEVEQGLPVRAVAGR